MPASLVCTCFTLRKLSRTVSRLYDRHLAEVGPKTTQLSLLENIAVQALPVAELAARLATDRATLTRNLKPLVNTGWAAFAPGCAIRQRIMTITVSGRTKLENAHLAQSELERTLGANLIHALHHDANTAILHLPPFAEKMHVQTD
jgi:DNA-binding MarR family transcriptional regulator